MNMVPKSCNNPAVTAECKMLQIETDLWEPGTEDRRMSTSQFTIISSSRSEPQTDVAAYSLQVEAGTRPDTQVLNIL